MPVQAPFHLEATVRVLQRRPANLIDTWDGGSYRRVVRLGHQVALLEVNNRGTIDAPDLRLSIPTHSGSTDERHEAVRAARKILGLEHDPAAAQRHAESEPALRETARALRGMRPPRYPDLFEAFANVIPFQQVSLEAGMSVVAHLVRRFGEAIESSGRTHHVFPLAEAIAEARTASVKRSGMSLRKTQSLRAAAKAIAGGALTAESLAHLSTADALERLMELGGIGPWSAALILLRGLGRVDVFPQADTGAESSLAALLRLRSRESLPKIVERFGDCRGYLYFYGLASRLLAAGLIHPAGDLCAHGHAPIRAHSR
ncbi:MAG TPA: AlkA N-terminal domain-containing protein [Steroidobacteraceae bacterium]|nr:AlkA N-terminal domain-containing protein [Steroidobacteraceae bacterium]